MAEKSLKRERDQSQPDAGSAEPPKRRRQEGDLRLAKLYEELAAESDETRMEAAKQIIVKFSPENSPSSEAVEKALHRLISGLCSARKAARFGFCVTLTELLRLLFSVENQEGSAIQALDLNVDGIIDLVGEKTKVIGNVPGKARRDHTLGKLFGYKAIMQSGILLEPKLSLDSWSKALDQIYTLARDVPWLREECGLILVEAVKSLDLGLKDCAREVIERLVSFNLANSPEGVAIWLTTKARFEDVLPANIWNSQDPLSKKDRTKLAKILKEDFFKNPDNGENGDIKSAAANPNPTFAWNLALSEVLRRDQAKAEEKDSAKREFPQFWLDTVDNNLFSSTASHERKSWGFKLFSTFIKVVPEESLSALFSPNLMRSMMNQSKKDDRFLHAAARAALSAVPGRVEQQPASALPIIMALTTKPGAIDFDRITKTKTLETIMLTTDDKNLGKIVRHLQSLVLRPDAQDQAIADSRRQIIADMLLNIVKNYKHYDDPSFKAGEGHENWLRKVLDIFVENAYFVSTPSAKTSKVPLPPLSDASRKVFQERLSSCLTRLLTVETDSRTSFASMTVGMIRSKAATSKSLELVFKAEKSIMKTIDKAFKSIDSITAKASTSSKKSAAEGFVLLYSLALLQVYDGDGDAVMLLADLDSSRKALLKGKQDPAAQGQDPFVEILLTFLGNPRTLFHKIAQEAFTIFASHLTEEGLESLTDILDTAENLEGQKELFEAGADIEDAGDDDMEDMEEASDVEMVDGELVNSKGGDDDESDEEGSDDSSDGDSSESGSDDDEDERDDDELIRFDNMLAHTLQTSKLDGDDSSDDSDMDDEQMMALDPHLTKIFQERGKIASQKQQRTDAKQIVIQFKSRVLDLLAIFMEKEYSNPLSLEVLLPLLRRIRAGASKQLADRSFKLLKTYTDSRAHHKAPLPKPENVESVWEILKCILEEAGKGGKYALHATACGNASLHVVKVLVGLDPANYAKVVDIYAEAQKQWYMDKKSSVQPTIFQQFLNWSAEKRRT